MLFSRDFAVSDVDVDVASVDADDFAGSSSDRARGG